MSKYYKLFRMNIAFMNMAGKFLSLLRLPQYYKLRPQLLSNKYLKSKRKSDTCYILGLGPSLKELNLTKIDEDIIAVNRFYLYDINKTIIPNYYCFHDPAFFSEDEGIHFKNAIVQYPDTSFLVNGKYIKGVKNIVDDGTKYYTYCMWNGIFNHKDKIDFCRNMPAVNNVLGVAILYAIYIGYKEIVLLGADFNSFASQKLVHCYNEEIDSRKWSMSFELFTYSFMADAHNEINEYAKVHNIRIINATRESLIDAYERNEDLSLDLLK